MRNSELRAAARAQLGDRIFGDNWLYAVLVILIVGAIAGAAGGVAVGIGGLIVVGPLSVGMAGQFLKQARDGQRMKIEEVFNGFKSDFGGCLLLVLMEGLFVMLWSLLLVVPGIIKAYGYSMAHYVKNDHPEYGWKECLDTSREMMRGHKGRMFMLDLSFLGWIIVGTCFLGVGTLWVSAYMEAAHAQFYQDLLGREPEIL